MAFTKITNSQLNSRGATTLPNQPKISATALKQEFDAPAKEIVAPAFNGLIDELEATTAAGSIGIVTPEGRGTSTNVQGVIDKISLDLAYLEGSVLDPIIEKAHTHDNKEVLDKFDETEGALTYDDETIGNMLSSDYDDEGTVKTAGGIVDYVESHLPTVLQTSNYTDYGGIRMFQFSDEAITTTSRIDYYCDVFGVVPIGVALSSGSLSVNFATTDDVTECAVEIK